MATFANLADGGRRLAVAMSDVIDRERAVLLAAIPNGVPVALEIGHALGTPVRALPVHRSSEGAVVEPIGELSGAVAIVVDDGVETGAVARAAAWALRDCGAAELVLAVPVCPREAMADLARRYDRVLAVDTPLVRRSLAWHYTDFDTIDEATAYELLDSRS